MMCSHRHSVKSLITCSSSRRHSVESLITCSSSHRHSVESMITCCSSHRHSVESPITCCSSRRHSVKSLITCCSRTSDDPDRRLDDGQVWPMSYYPSRSQSMVSGFKDRGMCLCSYIHCQYSTDPARHLKTFLYQQAYVN